jgi:hypothetical protein
MKVLWPLCHEKAADVPGYLAILRRRRWLNDSLQFSFCNGMRQIGEHLLQNQKSCTATSETEKKSADEQREARSGFIRPSFAPRGDKLRVERFQQLLWGGV